MFGLCHKSESLLYQLGFSRFDRRVQPILSVLADKMVALFLLQKNHNKLKGGMQVTPEEKKAWAEDLLQRKCKELGRLPTKKDFDSATCAQIKAYLGPWPRALESAGLKPPKEK